MSADRQLVHDARVAREGRDEYISARTARSGTARADAQTTYFRSVYDVPPEIAERLLQAKMERSQGGIDNLELHPEEMGPLGCTDDEGMLRSVPTPKKDTLKEDGEDSDLSSGDKKTWRLDFSMTW